MADLHISKQTISELLNTQGNKIIIPEYQRPYKWDLEKCEILWNDLISFFESKSKDPYFLGTIVSFENENKDQEIIDGQQRITSLLLLLRAFYFKLERWKEENDDVKGLKQQIEPCIWDIDDVSQKVTNKENIRIRSLVATESDNESLHQILINGDTRKQQDNYSKNYKFFIDKCDELARNTPMDWYKFCVTILKKCIILPIKCNTQDTALTIFSTLNDRGMPLEDADIFKAELYKLAENKTEFIEKWKLLVEICTKGNLSVNDVFRYYTHILRSKDGIKDKEIGLRKFYSLNDYSHLHDKTLLSKLTKLAQFWCDINTSDNDNLHLSDFSLKALHCLSCYPNDYWRYVVSVFYIKYYKEESFNTKFERFLFQLVAFFYAKFVASPTVNAIKQDTFEFCISIEKEENLKNSFSIIDEDNFKKLLLSNSSSTKITKGLLLIYIYLDENQKLIKRNFEVEHILPKNIDKNYHTLSHLTNEEKINLVENIGNKTFLEKKLNIGASDNFFSIKKEKYNQSTIIDAKNIAKNNEDWGCQQILSRENKIKSDLTRFFKKHLPV